MVLRQVFVLTESYVLLKPEVMVFRAGERFDEPGKPRDESTRKRVQELVVVPVDWARQLQQGSQVKAAA